MIKTQKSTHILLIVLAVVIIYSNSLNAKFVWDDEFLIVENPYVKNWHNLDIVFTKHIYHGANKLSNYYRPLQLVSYMVDYSLWQLNPFGYHLANLSLHAMNSIIVYLVILALVGSSGVSLLTALLFASAPVISSAAYYISARADLLVSMFMLISVLAFIKYGRDRKPRFYIASVLFFILALLSRENAVILPLLLILVFFQVNGSDLRRCARFAFPFIIILLAYIFLRISVLNFNVGTNRIITASHVAEVPFLLRLLTDFKVLLVYLRLLIFPFGLHMDRFIKPAISLFEPDIMFSIGVVAFLLLIAKKASRNYPHILFGVLWFFIALLPLLNIYPLSTFLHEMWLYLPSIGFFLIMSVVILKIINTKFNRIVTRGIIGIFLLYFSIIAVAHGRVWMDSVSLFKNTIRHNHDNPYIYLMHANLALAHFDKNEYKEAVKEARYAVDINPNFSGGYNNLGIFNIDKKEYIAAIRNFKKSIKLNQDNAAAYLNLSLTYNKLGYRKRAMDAINRCISLNPDYYKPYCVLGLIHVNLNEFDKARMAFTKALTLNRDSFEARYYLGTVYLKEGDFKYALKEYGACLRLNEGSAEFYNNLAILYIKLGRVKDAEDALIYAKEIDKNYAGSYCKLGNLYAGLGMFDIAVPEYKKAVSLNPGDLKTRFNLVKVYKDLYKVTSDKSFYYKGKKERKKASILASRKR